MTRSLWVALDTSTEQLVVGIGAREGMEFVAIADDDAAAYRRANAELLSRLSGLLAREGISMSEVAGIVAGRGPGSFTGVRIGVASAKGLAQGLAVPLLGVRTLDAIAHSAAHAGIEGLVGVVGDAMRGEVYPALFRIGGGSVRRQDPDTVGAPERVAAQWAALGEPMTLLGNGLAKYEGVFAGALGTSAVVGEREFWVPTSRGMFSALTAGIISGSVGDGEPASLLPIYTRLPDAEENERLRSSEAAQTAGPPPSGVSGGAGTARYPAAGVARPPAEVVRLRAMSAADIDEVVALEQETFEDVWTPGMFAEELTAPARVWLVAESNGSIIGYGGVALLADEAHVMDIAVRSGSRRAGIGSRIVRALIGSARALGAQSMTLEVRASNTPAIALYEAHGFVECGRRAAYYSASHEDAVIMSRSLGLRVSATGGDWAERDSIACGTDVGEPVVLAIESSCDETAASVMSGGQRVLSDVVSSQIDFHARFGGVVPEIASRKHTEAIVGVVAEAMDQAGTALGCGAALPFSALDAIGVTQGPGLVGALVVGLAYAKGLSMATGVPLVGVNHLEGHLFANALADEKVRYPLVALVVSGGHTSLIDVPKRGRYRTMGETLDDAAGEAFDKVAKVLGLGYPGGPVISRLAETGNPAAIDFPRAMLHSGNYSFSLSGLKTAVINHIRHEREAGREIDLNDLAASFQAAVVDVQVAKAVRAVKETGAASFVLGGGVAANPSLRDALIAAIEPLGVHVSVPPFHLCTDNAAMIAAATSYRYHLGERIGLDAEADPGLRIDTHQI